MKKLVIVSGGHVTPAISLINEIEKDKGWKIYYFGTRFSPANRKVNTFEFETLSKKGSICFVHIFAGKLDRVFRLKTILNFLKIPIGFFQALFQLLKIRPKVIISFGGYTSLPVVIMGWFLGIPSIAHEQTPILGLANRLGIPFVKKIAVSYPELMRKLPKSKTVFTGNLVRPEIFNQEVSKNSIFFKFLAQNTEKPLIYITGGKSGAKIINRVIQRVKPRLEKEFLVIHQIGTDESLEREIGENYISVRYLGADDIGPVLNGACLVVSRAGANITFDLLALGKPAILIPIPSSAGDEQRKNASFLKDVGLAKIIEQDHLNERILFESIFNMAKNVNLYKVKKDSFWANFDFRKVPKVFWKLTLDIISENGV